MNEDAQKDFAGIDVSKSHLDVAFAGQDKVERFANTSEGRRNCADYLAPAALIARVNYRRGNRRL